MENSNTELTKKFCPLRKGGFTVEEISKSYYGNLYRAAAALKFDQILALEDKNSNADVSKMLAEIIDDNSMYYFLFFGELRLPPDFSG